MTKGYFIGIDQGSSSTKAIAVDSDGHFLGGSRRDLSPPVREGDRVEHDPEEVLASVRQVIDEVFDHACATGHPLLGLGLSCQRSSCLLWEAGTGAPLSPVLSWRDTRGSAMVDDLASETASIFDRTGLPLTPYYAASKLRWLWDNIPAARESGSVLGTLSSFLCQRMTGASAPLIDHTHAARTQLMDIRSMTWDRELIGLFGLEGVRLPEIVPTAHQYGLVATRQGSAPLLACLGDQQAAMLGLGVADERRGGINYGTGGFLMVNTGTSLVPVPRLMASVHFSTADRTSYLVEGSVNAVGDGLAWLRTNFGLFRRDSELEPLCRTASTDVAVFLGLNGTGAPHWERDIGSAIQGLTPHSTAADIVRGAVEGIAFFMADIAAALRASNIRPMTFTVSGGLSSLRYLVEAQAALLGSPLLICDGRETSALGAAFLAGLGLGAWTIKDLDRLLPTATSVDPLQDKGLEQRYHAWQALHRYMGLRMP